MTFPDAFASPPPAHPAILTDPDVERGLVIEDQHFSIVPEWVIDADLPDAAFRLYALLLRYGGTSGWRMPSRNTLARRLRRSVDAVDRAMKVLVKADIVLVEHRHHGGAQLTNRYFVRTRPPVSTAPGAVERDGHPGAGEGRGSEAAPPAAGPAAPARAHATSPVGDPVGRTGAAHPQPDAPVAGDRGVDESAPDAPAQGPTGGRTGAGVRRTDAARMAAELRLDPESSTQRTPPPPGPSSSGVGAPGAEEEAGSLMSRCGIADRAALDALAQRCARLRRSLGQSTIRWAAPCLAAALEASVRGRGWPAHLAVPALLLIAADPETRSPMRLAEAGPWWDQPATPAGPDAAEEAEVARLEERLREVGGRRLVVQAAARAELTEEGVALTRSSVSRRACEILDRDAAPSEGQDVA